MYRRSWSEILERIGSETFDFADDLSEITRNYICDLWYRFPDKLAGKAGILGAFPRGFMNKACQGFPLPSPPSTPFNGGQCCDKTYLVDVYYRIVLCYQGRINVDTTATVEVTGRVLGAVIRPWININTNSAVYVKYEDCSGNAKYQAVWSSTRKLSMRSCRVETTSVNYAENVDYTESIATIQGIRTKDGSPDNCGNQQPGYRISPPLTLPDVTNNYTVNLYDGDTTEINIKPRINIEADFNADIDLEMPINVDVNGIKVGVDLTGLTFYGDDNNDSMPNGEKYPILPPPSTPSLPPPEIKPPNVDDYKREFPDNPNPPPGVEPPEVEEVESNNADRVAWLIVEIAQSPQSGKAIFQRNENDNSYFAGYVSWLLQIEDKFYRYPEIPIRKARNAFLKPIGATGYRVYAIHGATLRVSVLASED